jgi:hypothetical protein
MRLGPSRTDFARLIWRRYREGGACARVHRHVGRPSNRARPAEQREQALTLVREKYSGDGQTRLARRARPSIRPVKTGWSWTRRRCDVNPRGGPLAGAAAHVLRAWIERYRCSMRSTPIRKKVCPSSDRGRPPGGDCAPDAVWAHVRRPGDSLSESPAATGACQLSDANAQHGGRAGAASPHVSPRPT